VKRLYAEEVQWTVFAPNDTAFANLPPSKRNEILSMTREESENYVMAFTSKWLVRSLPVFLQNANRKEFCWAVSLSPSGQFKMVSMHFWRPIIMHSTPSLRRFPSVALETISILLWFMMALSQLFKEDILHLALLLSTPRSPCDQWCDVPPDTYIYNRVYLRIFITECIGALCMCCTLYVSFSVSVSSFFLALSLSLLVTSNSQLKTHYM